MTDKKEDPKKPKSLAEMDYQILSAKFGKQKALEIMRLANALHEEAAVSIGRKEQKDS